MLVPGRAKGKLTSCSPIVMSQYLSLISLTGVGRDVFSAEDAERRFHVQVANREHNGFSGRVTL